jgi:large subunit ribosomal protein L16
VEYWVVVVKPGTVLFELDGVTTEIAMQALRTACYKLPVKTRILRKE